MPLVHTPHQLDRCRRHFEPFQSANFMHSICTSLRLSMLQLCCDELQAGLANIGDQIAVMSCRLALPTSEIKDTHLTAFGDQEIGRKSLEDPLVLFNPPTLGFVDQVLASTAHISEHFSQVTESILVRPFLDLSCQGSQNVRPHNLSWQGTYRPN